MDDSPTLWIKGGSFDLVLTYVNISDMKGLELQQVINQEFALLVVFDDKDGTILKGLKGGAAVFIAKLISDDLRDLWLYATLQDKKALLPFLSCNVAYNHRSLRSSDTGLAMKIAAPPFSPFKIVPSLSSDDI
ncbi:hypothetical protein RND71_036446 [Anisodus tanguticus]|uniref:Uncharacterized protein n=1 Tax=Anisodus tanguticus TaxID=243964 RepID=A0AAE1R428_9SOLA|nr:hypothetical protein RND71_036446 [Anisodus tanguticus]